MTELINYDWPGNVRELYNYTRNAIIRTPLELNSYIYNLPTPKTYNKNINDIVPIETHETHDLRLIKTVLNQTHGNIKQSAEILQIDRNTLY
ncbi:MAG: helix-turn-helix domain-containing protein, partial [Sedimentibacter sp.]